MNCLELIGWLILPKTTKKKTHILRNRRTAGGHDGGNGNGNNNDQA